MLDWFRRLRKVSRKLSLPSRDATAGRSQIQLNISKLTPPAKEYLAALGYHLQSTAALLAADSRLAPNQSLAKQQLALSGVYRTRAREVSSILSKMGEDPIEAMDVFVERIELLQARTAGVDWYENLMRLYLVAGLLEDVQLKLAQGLSGAKRSQVEKLLGTHPLENFAKSVLEAAIAEDRPLGSRLALWGRSLIADALLEVRALVSVESIMKEIPEDRVELARAEFKALEPLTTDLIGAHAERMDALGLTA